MRKIWLDTETTGLSDTNDQVLTLGVIVDDEKGNEIERKEFKIKLKDGVIPSPRAIIVNKLRPLNKSYTQNSLTEFQVAKELEALGRKHTVNGKKPQFVAYNAEFDKGFTSVLLQRSGSNFNDLFSKSIIDPMKTVKKLIEQKKLKTRENAYGKPSASLEATMEALGEKYDGEAHSALTDADALRRITPRLHRMATGSDFYSSSVDPSQFEVGKIYHIETNSRGSGAKSRHVKILKNDHETSMIVALDEDDLRKNGFKPSAIRSFNYDTIVNEKPTTETGVGFLENTYSQRESEIVGLAAASSPKNPKLTKSKIKDKPVFAEESRDFARIKDVSFKMLHAKDFKEEYFKLKTELEKELGDTKSASSVLTKAENLAQAMGFEGWTEQIFDNKKVRMEEFKGDGESLKVVLMPSGEFKIALSLNGKMDIRLLKNKKDLMKLLKEKGASEALEMFCNDLPDSEVFKNPSHPYVIENDLKFALDFLKVNKHDEAARLAIGELLLLLKAKFPETFNKYNDVLTEAEKQEFDKDYFVPTQSNNDGVQELLGNEDPTNGVDSSGGKKVGARCKMCNRPISPQYAVYGMGPSCRAKSEYIESSNEPLENFVTEFKQPSNEVLNQGEVAVVKYKSDSGNEIIYAEKLSSTDEDVALIDRRSVTQLTANGESAFDSAYLSLHLVEKDSVEAVGKVKVDPNSEEG